MPPSYVKNKAINQMEIEDTARTGVEINKTSHPTPPCTRALGLHTRTQAGIKMLLSSPLSPEIEIKKVVQTR